MSHMTFLIKYISLKSYCEILNKMVCYSSYIDTFTFEIEDKLLLT